MTKPTNRDEKVAIILKDLSNNYPVFLSQAKTKMFKHRQLCGTDAYKELVSDVIFSLIQKLNNIEDINRFYMMTLNNKLRLYILKGISTNTSYYSAPFLQKKLKENNRLTLFDNINYFITDEDEEDNLIKDALETSVLTDIKSMLESPRACLIFGDEWKYYTMLFKEYISTDASYQTLADKYDIPRSSIAFHIRIVKDKIRAELNKTQTLY